MIPPLKIKKQLEEMYNHGQKGNDYGVQKFVPTTLEFYPNYENNTVCVSMWFLGNDMWRVCMWGKDDYGFEIDLEDFETAINIFKGINRVDKIPEGFVPA